MKKQEDQTNQSDECVNVENNTLLRRAGDIWRKKKMWKFRFVNFQHARRREREIMKSTKHELLLTKHNFIKTLLNMNKKEESSRWTKKRVVAEVFSAIDWYNFWCK